MKVATKMSCLIPTFYWKTARKSNRSSNISRHKLAYNNSFARFICHPHFGGATLAAFRRIFIGLSSSEQPKIEKYQKTSISRPWSELWFARKSAKMMSNSFHSPIWAQFGIVQLLRMLGKKFQTHSNMIFSRANRSSKGSQKNEILSMNSTKFDKSNRALVYIYGRLILITHGRAPTSKRTRP